MIHVLNNAVPAHIHEAIMQCAGSALYRIGWSDTPDMSRANHKYLHSTFNLQELESLQFLESIDDERMLELIAGRKPAKVVVNLSVPSDVNFSHTHLKQDVLLYYVNLDWKEEWAGETLFFSPDRKEVVFASAYTPNRAIFFDGQMPHSIRPQSVAASHYRFTLTLLFDKV